MRSPLQAKSIWGLKKKVIAERPLRSERHAIMMPFISRLLARAATCSLCLVLDMVIGRTSAFRKSGPMRFHGANSMKTPVKHCSFELSSLSFLIGHASGRACLFVVCTSSLRSLKLTHLRIVSRLGHCSESQRYRVLVESKRQAVWGLERRDSGRHCRVSCPRDLYCRLRDLMRHQRAQSWAHALTWS